MLGFWAGLNYCAVLVHYQHVSCVKKHLWCTNAMHILRYNINKYKNLLCCLFVLHFMTMIWMLTAQLLKVRNRTGICSRGSKFHAKFMVVVWGIKICALKAPVQWRWSYTIMHPAPEEKHPKPFYCIIGLVCMQL